MSNHNQNNQSGTRSTALVNTPFAGLTFDQGKVGLTESEAAPAVTATTVKPTTPAQRPVMPPAMLRRHSVPALLASTKTAAKSSNANPTPAAALPIITAADTEQLPVAPVAPTELTGWELLEHHKATGRTITGRVLRVERKRTGDGAVYGVRVRAAGLECFAPFRRLGWSLLETEHSVTLEFNFRVIELGRGVDNGKDRIILDRLLVTADEKTANLIRTVKLGDTVDGVIRKIVNFGAFVNINGASALIRLNDLPRGSTSSVKVGQKVKATVVKIDEGQNQLGLSIKHFAVRQLTPGDVITGPVKNEEHFGVFVQLNETIDGLVHCSKFGEFQPKKGNLATVKVLSINKELGQVQLALLDVKAADAAE